MWFPSLFGLILLPVAVMALVEDSSQVDWVVEYVDSSYTKSGDDFVGTHSYSVTVGNEDLTYWVLNVQDCEDQFTLQETGQKYSRMSGSDSATGVQGVKWAAPQTAGSTKTYTLTTHSSSPLKMADFDYSVAGSTRFAKDTVSAPACEMVKLPVCNAGQERQAVCSGHKVTLSLSGSGSAHSHNYDWQLPADMEATGVVLSSNKVVNPIMHIPTEAVCSADFDVTLTVTDAEGKNPSSCSVHVTFKDESPPDLAGAYFDEVVTAQVDDVPSMATLTALDSCDSSVVVIPSEQQTNSVNAAYTITRTWTAEDRCGNEVSKSQTVNVVDTVDPELFGVDGDLEVQCNAVPDRCEPYATDASSTTIEYTESRHDGSCKNEYTLLRIWVVTDEAGNKASASQTIKVSDNEAPVLSAIPADAVVECDETPVVPEVTAVDDCEGSLSVNFVEERSQQADGSPNTYTIVRTWSASDHCGNLVSSSQTLTVGDFTPPTMTEAESDQTVSCAAVPPECVVEADDNCDSAVNLSMTQKKIAGSCSNSYSIEYTWLASDSSGNSATQTQTITVEDNEAPELHGLPPQAISVECSDVPEFSVTATDNCDGNSDVQFTENKIEGSCDDAYSLERVWSSSDACGNSDSFSQEVTVSDNSHPTLDGVPPSVEVECNQVPTPADVEGRDNCDHDVAVKMTETNMPGSCIHDYSLVRAWVGTDNCGNIVSEKQTISVLDDEAPTLVGLPGDLTVPCPAYGGSIPDAPTVTAIDNCGEYDVDFTEEHISGSCPCDFTLKRTWDVTDACGNSASHVQTIQVNDNNPPTITGVPSHLQVECDDISAVPDGVTGSDLEDGPLTPTFVSSSGTDTCDYTITRKWSVVDGCGNKAEESQTVEVLDRNPPVWGDLPPSLIENLEYCEAEVPDAFDVTATDACHHVTVSPTETEEGDRCHRVVHRQWNVQDPCGNAAPTVSRTWNVRDTSAPIFSGNVDDVEVQCDAIPEAPTVSASDCGDDITPVFSSVPSAYTCDHNYKITRKWVATDVCNNKDTVTQVVTVVDTTDPVLTVPGDQTIPCGTSPVPVSATASDNCASVPQIITSGPLSTQVSDGTKIVEQRVWTFTAFDKCGNSVSDTMTVFLEDTEAPTLTDIPPNIKAECDAVPTSGSVKATDNCDDVVVDYTEEIFTDAGLCDDHYFLIRTWSVTDHVGLTSSGSQTVTVEDNTAPTLVGVPSDKVVTLECDEEPPTPPTVTATDNCDGNPTVEFTVSAAIAHVGSTNPSREYDIVRTWTATDRCGNEVSDSQTIQFRDTESPVILENFDETVYGTCEAPEPPTVTASDNCGPVTVTGPSGTPQVGSCQFEFELVRTWVATDAVGRTATSSQTVIVADDADPTWTIALPTDFTVQNADNVPSLDEFKVAAEASAADNCNVVDVVVTEDRTELCGDGYTLTRKAVATDACGRSTSHEYTITVEDKVPPALSGVPADSEQPCTSPVTVPSVICDGVAVTPQEGEKIYTEDCSDAYSQTFTWSCADDCGNPISDSWTLSVTQAGPSIVAIDDVSRECSDDAATFEPDASDDCSLGALSVSHTSTHDNEGTFPYAISHTWTAKDACGETATTSAVETVQDTTPPTIELKPEVLAQLVVEWGLAPNPSIVDIVHDDNCGATPKFEAVTEAGTCVYEYTIVSTYTAVDHAGNENSVTRTITVEDTTAPVLHPTPSDVTLYFDEDYSAPTVTAYDPTDVDAVLSVTMTEQSTQGATDKDWTITRTWSVEDLCGNAVTHQQVVTLVPPPEYPVPLDYEIECDEDVTSDLAADKKQIVDYIATLDPVVDATVAATETKADGTCPAAYTLTREFTITPASGTNVVTLSYVITVVDSTPPHIGAVAPTTSGECAPPGPEAVTATDNCIASTGSDGAVTVTSSDGAASSTSIPYSFVRTYSATDDCGHVSTASQVVNVVDTTPPTVTADPDDATGECSEPEATVEGEDNCGADVTVSGPVEGPKSSPNCDQEYSFTRTWTLTDASGLTTPVTQVVSVEDNTPPTWITADLPVDVTYECSSGPIPTLEATDACTQAAVPVYENVVGPDANGVSVRTWTATDPCGNSIVHKQTVTIDDTTAPTWTSEPQDKEEQCVDGPVVPPVATDNCGTPTVTLTPSTVPGDCGHVTTRTWVAEDSNGNTATSTQIVTVKDTTPPVLTVSTETLTVGCDDELPSTSATANDNCDADPVVTDDEETTASSCANDYTVVRSWTATDACGLTDTKSKTILVVDNESPVLVGVPLPKTVSCVEGPGDAPTVTADDNCATISAALSETSSAGDCDNAWTVTRTWTANDGCGEAVTDSQVITVTDTDAPTLVGVPGSEMYECGSVPDAAVTATDTCDSDITPVATVETVPGANTNEYNLIRTWVATDDCGNAATGVQEVTVEDTTPPTLANIPPEATYECDAPFSDDDDTATASDNCDLTVQASWTSSESGLRCSEEHSLIVTWTATDISGNTETESRTMKIEDSTPPTWTSTPDVEVSEPCVAPPVVAPEATDNCDPLVAIVFSETPVSDYVTVRKWVATDECGNAITHKQTVTVVDVTPPTITGVGGPWSGSCLDTPLFNVDATDNCDPVTVDTSTDSTLGSCDDAFVTVITYTATDSHGNAATETRTLTYSDTIAPVIASPPSTTGSAPCHEDVSVPSVVASDNCKLLGFPAVHERTTTAGSCADAWTITDTWTATDTCGNSALTARVTTVTDSDAPVLSTIPDDNFVDCDNVPPPATVTASDLCDDDVPVNESETTTAGSCVGEWTIIRSWSASDNCGNSASDSQTLTVRDSNAPTLSIYPEDVTYECEPDERPTVTATDDCDPSVSVVFSEQTTSSESSHEYVSERTWVATDACGNAVTHNQKVTVDDTTPPSISGPGPLEAECDEVPNLYNDQVSVDDTCSSATLVCSKQESDFLCDHSYTITRTCTATDEAGNTNSFSQTVTISDTTPPVLAGVPNDATILPGEGVVEADEVVLGVSAWDACAHQRNVVVTESRVDGTCDDAYDMVRSFSATDECGNEATETQTVSFDDTEPCVFNEYPADVTVECDSSPDACVVICEGEDLEPEVSNEGLTTLYTWTHTDACGNTETHTQRVTLEDTTAPVLARLPADETVECSCDTFPGVPNFAILDNCDSDPVETFSESKQAKTGGPYQTGQAEYILVRTWTATDSSGNSVTYDQSITVEDTTAPSFSHLPTDTDVQCDDVPATPQLYAMDNCDDSPTVVHTSSTESGGCANSYTTVNTWIATDSTGNAVTASQTVNVEDSQSPVLTSHSEKVCVENNGRYWAFLQAQTNMFEGRDNCGGGVTVQLTSCRSTQTPINADGFSEECYLADTTLYIKGERNENVISDGRTYHVAAVLIDACGNEESVSREFWVPQSPSDVDGLSCKRGTYTNHA